MLRTALIVDDSGMARKLLRKVLPPEWQVEVHEAASGQEGLDACLRLNVDVLFLDMTMPGMDGMEVLDRLKKHPGRPQVTIVVTADVQPRTKAMALLKGAFEFIGKPASTESIRQTLRTAGML